MTITHPPLRAQEEDPDEAKRWLIIGAYRAGAHEKAIARISGLSRTAVRQIILNYRQTGTPSLPKPISRKVKDKPIVEYDEEGNLIDVDSDHEEPRQQLPKQKQPLIGKANKKVVRQPTTKDVIAYVVDQVHRSDYSVTNDDIHEVSWSRPRPLTPPRDNFSSGREDTPSSSSHFSWNNGDNNTTTTSSFSCPSSSFMPLSPPRPGKRHSQPQQHALPPVRKFDQTIRGYEIWTHEDDMILMEHMLTRLKGGRWRELEAKLEGRHSARLCRERWSFLQSLLLKGVANVAPNDTNSADQQ